MYPNSVIPQSDDRLLSYFLKEALEGFFFSDTRDSQGRKRDDTALLIYLGLILIVATEPFKVILRRNIGKLALSLPRLSVAVILYLLWATMLIVMPMNHNFEFFDYILPLQIAGVLYVIFALYVLFRGISEYSNGQQAYIKNQSNLAKHLYRGRSLLYSGDKKGWLKEPRVCFFVFLGLMIISGFIHPILLLIFAPLLATSISFWFNEWFQVNNVWNVQSRIYQKEQQKNQYQQQNNYSGNDFAEAN